MKINLITVLLNGFCFVALFLSKWIGPFSFLPPPCKSWFMWCTGSRWTLYNDGLQKKRFSYVTSSCILLHDQGCKSVWWMQRETCAFLLTSTCIDEIRAKPFLLRKRGKSEYWSLEQVESVVAGFLLKELTGFLSFSFPLPTHSPSHLPHLSLFLSPLCVHVPVPLFLPFVSDCSLRSMWSALPHSFVEGIQLPWVHTQFP